ncbi:MAG: VWA domain-containing protein [Terracidiphilus sp.]
MKQFLPFALLAGATAVAQQTHAPVLPPAPAMQTGPDSQNAPGLRTESNVVLVPTLVLNAKGETIFNLRADDFRITDDGIEQKLTLDQDTDNEPMALVVAVQSGGAGRAKLESYRNLGPVIGTVVGGVPHRVAVVEFDSAPSLVQDFSPDAEVAGAALGDVDAGDKGAAILDAIKFSADLLRKQPANYRRAILLISETLDHGSHTRINEALRAISDTNTAIYAVGFSSGKAAAANYGYHELPVHKTEDGGIAPGNAYPNPPHGCMGKDPDPEATQNKAVQAYDCMTQLLPPLAFAKMAAIAASDAQQRNVPETVAQLTGGEYFKFENRRMLVNDLVTISNHVPNRYVLSFQALSPHPGYHVVQLKLKNHPHLRLTARGGYWADDAGAAAKP